MLNYANPTLGAMAGHGIGMAGGTASGVLPRFLGDLAGIMDMPRQGIASGLMALANQGAAPPPPRQITPRDMATAMSGMMGAGVQMPGAMPGSILPQAASAAGMAAGPALGIPGSIPADPIDIPMEMEAMPEKRGSLLPLLMAAGGALAGSLAPASIIPRAAMSSLLAALGAGIGQAGTGDVFSTEDVLNQYGLPSNAPMQFLAGTAMDPLTYVGATLGGLSAAPSVAEQRLGAMAAREAGLTRGTLPNLPMTGTPAPTKMPFPLPEAPPVQTPTLGGYTGEQLGSILGGGPVQISPGEALASAKMYKRVNPEVSALLQQMGFMDDTGALTAGLPNWADVRGGRVLPARGMEGLMPHMQDLAGLTEGFGHDARMRMLERLMAMG